jgi:hypothetical protein
MNKDFPMRCRFILTIGLLGLSSFAFAGDAVIDNYSRFGIQGAMATGGNLGIGIVNFTPTTELGLTVSGSVNNAPDRTQTITPVLFGGFRKALGERTYFAYGIDLAGTYGRIYGEKIDSDYGVGPYISLEQMLTAHLMLTGWIQPYQYHYQKRGVQSVSTNNFFSTGGVGLNYFF